MKNETLAQAREPNKEAFDNAVREAIHGAAEDVGWDSAIKALCTGGCISLIEKEVNEN